MDPVDESIESICFIFIKKKHEIEGRCVIPVLWCCDAVSTNGTQWSSLFMFLFVSKNKRVHLSLGRSIGSSNLEKFEMNV